MIELKVEFEELALYPIWGQVSLPTLHYTSRVQSPKGEEKRKRAVVVTFQFGTNRLSKERYTEHSSAE